MVIKMEPWDPDKIYDRTGMEVEHANILDIDIPQYTIPVKPGRNLAVIMEVAAMNVVVVMGYNVFAEPAAQPRTHRPGSRSGGGQRPQLGFVLIRNLNPTVPTRWDSPFSILRHRRKP